VNLKRPAPKSELALSITADKTRLVVVRDAQAESSPALLLAVDEGCDFRVLLTERVIHRNLPRGGSEG
jgi:phage-related baseplate assembly protein